MKTRRQQTSHRQSVRKSAARTVALSAGALAAVSLAANRAAAQSLQVFTQWNFDNITPGQINNSPAPTTGTGVATALGMTNNYVLADGSHNSVNTDDVTNTGLDALQASGPGVTYAWRVRGGPSTKTQTENGWSTAALQYTQGVEFDTDTTGHSGLVFSCDWFSTSAGIHNLQEQYTVDGTDWINVNPLQANVPNGWVYGLKIDFGALGITDVNNDPNFGVRLVSAYDPNPPASGQTYSGGDGSSIYNNLSGNWRFANVTFSSTSTNGAGSGGPPSLTWSPPSATWNGTNTNWKDSNGATVSFGGTSTVALFTDSAISSPTATATVNVASGGVAAAAVNVSNTNGTYVFSGGPISGGVFTKTGAGNVVLQGSNTFGGLNLLGGTLHTAADANLGAAGARVLLNGGTLVADAAFDLAHPVSVGTNGGTLAAGAFALTNSGALAISGPLVKTGTGDLTLTGSVTTNPGGTLRIAGGNVIFAGTTSAAIIAVPATTNTFAGNVVVANPKGLTFVGGTVDGPGSLQIQVSGASLKGDSVGGTTLTHINMPIQLNSLNAAGPFAASVGSSGVGDVTVLDAGAVISGNATVTLAGGNNGGKGTLVLASQSTYVGDTIINNDAQGLTRLGIDNPLPVTTNLSFGDGSNAANIGALDLNGHDLAVASVATNLPGGTNQIAQYANGIANTASATRMSTLTISGSATTTTLNATIGTPTGVILNNGLPANNIAITLAAANTGTLVLQGTNTYTGPTTVNGGTLQFDPATATIGSATQSSLPANAVVVNNASLVINSPASVASSISGSGTTTVNAPYTSYINTPLAPALTVDTITQGALVNNGVTTINSAATIGTVSGSNGALIVGNGGGPANASLGSFNQAAVTINDNAKVTLTGGTAVTSATPSLTLNGSGTLDLAGSGVALNYGTNATPLPQVKQWVFAGRNGGVWTGTGGITSSAAAANPSRVAVGFVDGGPKGTATVPANTVLARATWVGDANLDGKVDSTDVNAIVQHGQYNTGHPASWADGDFNFDGLVTSQDVNAIVQAGQYLKPAYSPGATGSAQPSAAKTLTARSVAPATAAPGTPGDGQPDFQYDPATGDVLFVRDGLDPSKLIQTLTLRSAGHQFVTGVGYTSQNNSGVDVDQTDEQFASRFSGIAKTAPFTFDLGNILPTNLTPDALKNDLSLFYDYQGDGATGDGIPAGVTVLGASTPEPAALSLLAVGTGALLARRRRRAK